MKKLFWAFAALALMAMQAHAQTYPSPTFNNVTAQGVLSLPNNPLALSSGGLGATTAAGGRTTLGLGTAATQNTGTNGPNVPLLNGANTWSGASQTFGAGSGNAVVQLNSVSGSSAFIQGQKSGTPRWSVILGNSTADSGSNVGSDFQINRHNDAGATIDSPIIISRSTGVVTLSQPLPVGSGGTGGTTQATARTGLGLGSIATQAASAVAITGGTVDGTTVGATTASTGRFTTLAATSTITPSSTAGIVGTTTNDNANAGSIGEYVQSETTSGTQVSLTSGSALTVTSISLTAGDWDVWSDIVFNPAGTTTVTGILGCINTTTNVCPSAPNGGGYAALFATLTTGSQQVLPVGRKRISLNATTTIYAIAFSNFGTSTMGAYGGIYARRVR